MTKMIAARRSPRRLNGSANLADELAPEIRKHANISWAFLNVCVSQPSSSFSRADRCWCLHHTPAGSTAGSTVRPSFIVFVIFMLNAPYFLLGIASQRNLRYNVPNR
jgi:hypothetical protein